MDIPDKIMEKFDSDSPLYTREIVEVKEIVGKSIITGVSSNEMDSEVGNFLIVKSQEDYMVVLESNEDGRWADVAVKFGDREVAEEFEELVSEKGGSLRLMDSDTEGWFSYEAE